MEKYLYYQVTADGLCLPRVILKQVVYHQHAFTPEMLFRMAAFQMIRNPRKYYHLIEWELVQTGESYESYCTNLFKGEIWGDDLIAAVISDMWHVAISVVSPSYLKPVPLFHKKKVPDIVIVANGGAWPNLERPCTHFSVTRPDDTDVNLPGYELMSAPPTNPTLAQDQVPKTLMPIMLSKTAKAKWLALQEYCDSEQDRSLKLLRGCCVQITNLEEEVCKLIAESENLLKYKTFCEYKLEKLGVSIDKIKEFGKLQDPKFCRTAEKEKIDAENEKKRKREEEKELREKKRQKGEGAEGNIEEETNPNALELEYEQKRYLQQKKMIQEQELIIQKQSIELMKVNTELFSLQKQTEERRKQEQKNKKN